MNICACGCNRYAPAEHAVQDAGGAWWRMDCLQRAGYLLRDVQNLPHGALGLVVSVLRENGRNPLADLCVGALPFDGRRQ